MLLALLLSCSHDKPSDGTDGTVDCPTPSAWYLDADGDAYGAGEATGSSCTRPEGHVANDQDCDDGDAAVHPGADEVCNDLDDDCDGQVDPESSLDILECWADADGDAFGDPDGALLACACGEGLAEVQGDCDDDDEGVNPASVEICDGVDNDCDAVVDEDLSGVWYLDNDGDAYGAVDSLIDGCPGTTGTWLETGGDCNDDDDTIHPQAHDLCDDLLDKDCDGILDECWKADEMRATDAWWTVYRDPDTELWGFLGRSLVHGGDTNGDGRSEVLAPVVAQRCEDYTSDACSLDYTYALFEAPSWTAGGEVPVDDAVIAAWAVLDDEEHYWTGSATFTSDAIALAGQDLDGDGYDDFILGAVGDWLDPLLRNDPAPSRLDLVYGPPEPEDTWDSPGDLSLAHTVVLDEDVSIAGPVELLTGPDEPGGWTVAAGTSPSDDALEGTAIPGLVILREAHFLGEEDLSTAHRLYAEPPYGMGGVIVEVGDVDGDGVKDLASSAYPWTGGLPPGRVWVFRGPFGADRDAADADYVVTGDTNGDYFGYSFSITPDMDGDGLDELAVNQRYDVYKPDLCSVRLYGFGGLGDSAVLAFDDSFGTITSTPKDSASGLLACNRHYKPSLVGDPDGDGVRELAITGADEMDENATVFLFDTPLSGTHSMADATGKLRWDSSVANGEGFGSSVIGGVDYDGDGLGDLLVGDWKWSPGHSDGYFGRFHVFRGADPME